MFEPRHLTSNIEHRFRPVIIKYANSGFFQRVTKKTLKFLLIRASTSCIVHRASNKGRVLKMAEEQLVTFGLGSEEFGLDIMRVQEIIRIPPITRVPKAPNYVDGVINLRGNVIPVVSLRTRFGMGKVSETDLSRIIVLQVQKKVFGIRVDAVTEVLRLDDSAIEPPPPVALGMDALFIRGVGKIGERLLILLDLNHIMGEEMHHEFGS